MSKTFRCPDCGVGLVQQLAFPGRIFYYRGAKIAVPDDLKIRTCDHCRKEFLHPEEASVLFEPIYQRIVFETIANLTGDPPTSMLAVSSLPPECDFNGVDDFITVHDSSVKRAVDHTDLYTSNTDLVECVAMAIVNAGVEGFGPLWPWPEGNTNNEMEAREDAREVARAAIRAIRQFEGK